MSEKKLRIAPENIDRLVDHNSGCMATDMITVEGLPVGYMYREPPDNEADSGWRFMSGKESDEYMGIAEHYGVYSVNTIANYDNDILPFLDEPIGCAFSRNPKTGKFEPVDSPVNADDCLHPEFPVVTGDYRLTSMWSIFLPLKFNRRIEDGTMVLWRPKVTLYCNIWNNDRNESIEVRLQQFKDDSSALAFEQQERQVGDLQQYSYRLTEDGINAFHGFVISSAGHLQMAVYFDDESDVELARSLLSSVAAGQ